MIRIKNINKYYETGGERVHAVRNLSVTFPDTGLAFIVGPSGSGKSTLLNLLGGLDKPDSGEIWIEDKEIKSFSKNDQTNYLNSYLGFVFQEYNILKDLTLKENIILPLQIQGVRRKKINQKFKQIIEDVDLKGLERRKISELSGGQKQRIAIARALIKDPKLIIADEPTGNLDSETSKLIFNIFKKLSSKHLIIIVTHDEESAREFGDMIVRISPDGDSLHEIINHNTELCSNIDETKVQKLKLKKAHIPLRTSLKLALKNMGKKFFRYLIMLLVCSLSLCFLAFTIELHVEKQKLRQNIYTMIENGYRITEIYQADTSEKTTDEDNDFYSQYAYTKTLNTDAYSDLKENLTSVTIHEYAKVKIPYTLGMLENTNSFYTGYIETLICYDETNEYDLICGRLPNPDKKEVLITDYIIAAWKNFDLYPSLKRNEDYLNLKINLEHNDNYTIVGVVKTSYEKWLPFQNITDPTDIDYSVNKQYRPFINDYVFVNSVILPKDYFNIEKESGISLLAFSYKNSGKNLGTWNIKSSYSSLDSVESSTNFALTSSNVSITSLTGKRGWGREQTLTFGRLPNNVKDGEIEEIALPIEMMSSLFPNISVSNNNKWNLNSKSIVYDSSGYINNYYWDVIREHYYAWEKYINNKTIELTLTGFEDGKEYSYTKSYKIVGLYFGGTNSTVSDYNYSGVISTKEYSTIQTMVKDVKPNILLELPKNKEQAYLLFNEAYKLGYVINVWQYKTDIDDYKVDEFIDLASKAGLYIFAVFAIGIIWTVVSIEIVDSKKEIGILRSIGLSSGRVASIFIFQCVSVILIAYVLGVYGAYKLIPIYNSGIKDEFNQIILYIYSFTYRTPLYLGIFTIVMSFVSTAFPLGKIMSQRIIDVINERDI